MTTIPVIHPFVSASRQNNWYNFAAWGDSLTNGAGGNGTTYPAVLSSLFGYRNVHNNNNAGGTSVDIRARFEADIAVHAGDFTIIWAGRNNYTDPTQVKADIAAMVAALPSPRRFLVMSVLNGNYAGSEYLGFANYNLIIALNNDLAALYPDNYLDIRAHLVSLYDPGTPQDVTDFGNDIPPSTLRSDAIHLNAAGYTAVGNRVHTWIAANDAGLGRTLPDLQDLVTIFGSPPPVGTVIPAIGAFTDLTAQRIDVVSGTGANSVAGPTLALSTSNYGYQFTIAAINMYSSYGGTQTATLNSGPKILALAMDQITKTALTFWTANPTTAATGGSEKMRIDYDGRVGIGIAAPLGRLQVHSYSDPYITGTAVYGHLVLSATSTSLQMGVSAASPYEGWIQMRHTTQSGFTYPLSIQPLGGKVGFGIITPTSWLHAVTGLIAATGDEIAYRLEYTTNKQTSGNDTGLLIQQTDTLSPGTSLMLDLQVGTTSKLSVNNTGVLTCAQYRLTALNTAPANAGDTGTLGEVRIDALNIYVCTATNTWKRAATSTW
ncbi:MAG: SGNH/GDSL hydrolase family protein [Nitrospirota bacterium]